MAEAVAISVARWVASPIVSRLLNEGFNYLGELGDADVKERLENLETTILPQFHLVIEAAERSNDDHKAKLKLWLRKLKDAMYEAEDMLDLCNYQLLEEKVHDLNSDSISKSFRKVGRGLSKILSHQNKRLRESLIKLEKVAVEAIKFYEHFLGRVGIRSITANNTIRASGVNVTTSLPPHYYVIGRNEERDDIINKHLLDPSEDCEPELSMVSRRNYSVVVITGIGGAGKTTLAQLVYNDQRVVDNFGIKMWVCMSRKLDVFKLTREMIESASKKECPRLENLDTLQITLTDMIKSKRVLLVLDDVWCYKSENETEWGQLLTPLAFGERGSKILVTSRPENIPNIPPPLRSQSIMKLKDLGDDEFVSLFMHHTFGETKLSESHLQEELEKIGKQILQKLRKSPLAAKAVGGQLSKRLQPNFWRAALEQDNLSDTQKTLMWSYHRLDAPLQRCFSYFSIFPKGHTFERKKLIHLWMAEGFINPSEKGKRMEDIGNDYFDELVSGSFLQLSEDYYGYGYGMHDLFHDLAENISKEDCFRIEGDQAEKIPSTIRHLYIQSKSMRRGMLEFHKLQNLRTLIVAEPVSKSDSDLLLTVMEKSKKLRVLDLSFNVSIKTLPKCIRDLKHLRYLDLRFSSVAELPMSLELHHLQVLKSPYKVKVLPRSLRNLFNLRHLKAEDEALSTLPDIGRLTSLQKLIYFEVKKENGHDIRQLKNLNELRRSLSISGLEKVEGKDEATGANLKDKKHLDRLCLKWDSGTENNRGMNLDMEIVEALQPPPNLTKLEIHGCKSLRCPSWLAREGCLENLKSLGFNDTSFKVLPTISSKLFPRCQELGIRSLPNLRTLPSLPPILTKLVMESCPLLVFVSEEELQKSDDSKKSIMTVVRSSQLKMAFELMGDVRNIRTMIASDCLDVKKLMESEKVDVPKDFQTFATALEGEEMSMQVDYLRLWEAYCCCQEQRLEAIFRRRERSELILSSELQHLKICSTNITDGALSLCLGGLSSLKTLRLRRIRTITTVPTDHLMALCDLEIDNCHCLKSLGGLHALLCLKDLHISSCPCLELEMMEGEGGGRFIFPPSLQSLSVCHNSCCNVKRFAIGDLPDLRSLLLDKWSSLASLSLSGLTALQELRITDCPHLSAVDCSQAPNNSSLESLGGTEDVPKLAATPPSEAVHLSSVEQLTISSYATLSMLLSGNNSQSLVIGLRWLTLWCCPEASFPEEHFSSLISLRILSLDKCQVQSLPRILKSLSSLEHLILDDCPNISSLSDLPHSLLYLSMHNCPGISSLPVRLPESLRSFSISRCPVLKERCRESKGEDWPKIANIPRVLIYD